VSDGEQRPQRCDPYGSPNAARLVAYMVGSVVLTFVAAVLAIGFAAGGHGGYWPATALFPWTMLSAFLCESITWPFVVLAIVQFPFYATVLARAGSRRSLTGRLAVIACVHIVAAVCEIALLPGDCPAWG